MLSASQFILPARFIRAAQSAARAEFRSSYFKNTRHQKILSALAALQNFLMVDSR